MNLNVIHRRVIDFLTKTDKPVFLTGKAGTGKTTFLHYLKTTIAKNIAIVAPTAIAALNAGGVTINSLFQIPFGPLIPRKDLGDFKDHKAVRMAPDKAKMLISLQLLIIDEISMVRADVIDRIDLILRSIKGSDRPFGGVQLLMIGDLYQLPPVYQNDWPILKQYYTSPYFFSSWIFASFPLVSFELTEVFRQADPTFINILNSIRDGNVDESLLSVLNRQFKPGMAAAELTDYITLSTHNRSVGEINETRLRDLEGEIMVYKAIIAGDFPKDAYPAEPELRLKVGAQVIFIKNDPSGKKQYYNGRTACVLKATHDSIQVRFLDDDSIFDVMPETWEHTKYALNELEGKIASSSNGSFTQYPIKLAWAITIHKSQGLTFDKAVIDVEAAFAHGQTYVALSRCRNLEGLILKAPVKAENVMTDARITSFMRQSRMQSEEADLLSHAMLEQEYKLIADIFDFKNIGIEWNLLKSMLQSSVNEVSVATRVNEIEQLLVDQVRKVADKFLRRELNNLDYRLPLAQGNFTLRLKQAVTYFKPKVELLLDMVKEILTLPIEEGLDPEFFEIYNQFVMHLKGKLAVLQIDPVQVDSQKLSSVSMEAAINYVPVYQVGKKGMNEPKISDLVNPLLLDEIFAWRTKNSEKRGVADYLILSEQLCIAIAAKSPKYLGELAQIKGIGVGKAKELGDEFVKIIRQFYGERDLFG
ncbi:AAA family ATPase [Olivibacter sp. LS-1]|jgi:hypothetical protein|uniref:AAA family ATPase n=1 Tax=Olivibacter sp. LS-1 TaxID=2592345 RepID=UPI0011EA90CB|nr:AAA family ATPase [Olivibacter sp. LS-1]QEL03599.1 AAA family ATPase [Olivibacter sp. LS-1]